MNDQVNVGAAPDDGGGDTLRGAMQLINRKFLELYTPLNPKPWATGVAYKAMPTREVVYAAGQAYMVMVDHTSTNVAADVAAGKLASFDLGQFMYQLVSDAGSSIVGFKQPSSGSAARTVQDKLRESVSVLDFYANGVSGARVDPTGVVDSTAGIQAAVNSGAKVVLAPAGTYKISSGSIVLPNGVSLIGDGSSSTIFDGSSVSPAALVNNAHIKNVGGTLTLLSSRTTSPIASAIKGARTLTFATPPSLVKGDILVLYNPDDFSWSGARSYYRAGEMVKVAAVAGSVVTLQSSLCDSYAAGTVDVYRLDGSSSCAMRGFSIKGVAGSGVVAYGLQLRHLVNSSLEDIKSWNSSYGQISLSNCFGVQLRGCTCEEDFSIDFGGDYGLVIANSQNIDVSGGYYASSRHGITTGGTASIGDVTCRNIYIHDATISTSGAIQALDFHGNTEYAYATNCVIDGGFAGGGDFIGLIDNQFKGKYGNGDVACYLSELRGLNITIAGNTMWADAASANRGMFVDMGGNGDALAASTRKGGCINITDNDFISALGGVNSGRYPIVLVNRGYIGAEPISANVSDNRFTSPVGGQVGNLYVRVIDATGSARAWDRVTVDRNTFDYVGGVVVINSIPANPSAKIVSVSNNSVNRVAAVGIYLDSIQDAAYVQGNRVTGVESFPISVSGCAATKCGHVVATGNTVLNNLRMTTGSNSTNSGLLIANARVADIRGNLTGSANKYLRVATAVGFVLGETITGGTSGATARIDTVRAPADFQILESMVGVFVAGETVTGGTSGATTTVSLAAVGCQSNCVYASNVDSLRISDNSDIYAAPTTLNTVTAYLAGSVLGGKANYDPPSLADGSGITTTVAVGGAKSGDSVTASFGLDLQGVMLSAWVSSDNTVSVRLQNETGGVVDLGNSLISVRLVKA